MIDIILILLIKFTIGYTLISLFFFLTAKR